MNWYRVLLEMRSWSASTWQADTIFGHLCWGMKYLYGEDELTSFLGAYGAGSPPLLVSNGFPGDLLPKPLMPRSSATPASLEDQKKEFVRNKDAKRARYLSVAEFSRVISGERVSDVLTDEKERGQYEIRHVTLKNQISRLTGTTGEEGKLYPFKEFHWKTVSLYLKIADAFVDKAKSLVDYLAESGYGKRKSVGYGQLKKLSFDPFAGFQSPSDANGFVSLSNFVPSSNDPANGNWALIVKYGKLGEEYSLEQMAFKRPLIMLEAGSTFYDSPCREFYGRLVQGVSPPNPQVVQYGFALPVPMRLPEPVASR